jgi:hypothetical protein
MDRAVADPHRRPRGRLLDAPLPRARRRAPTLALHHAGLGVRGRRLAHRVAFAFYTSSFGSYNKTWGSLAAVIIMLTWLWLAAIALLLGAEINAEAERSRELREGRPAERELLVPSRSG